jgi:hypothetical protein
MTILAAASGPGTAQNVRSLPPMMSPPTCVSGSRTLTDSRTNLRRTAARSHKRSLAGNNNHQPTPATETVKARVSTTNSIPQPTLATAALTASKPDHAVRPMLAAIAVHQAIRPTCLRAPMPTFFNYLTSHTGPVYQLRQLSREYDRRAIFCFAAMHAGHTRAKLAYC